MRSFRRLNLNSERGSTTILSISILFFGVLVIFLFANFAKMFAVSDRANTSAEQASLAGTSVVYEEMMSLIETFHYVCGQDEEGLDIMCALIDDFTTVKSSVRAGNPSYTSAQVNRKSIDQLLVDKIPAIDELGPEVKTRLLSSRDKIKTVIKNVITKNKGKTSGTRVKYFNNNNRIEVRTSATFDSIETSIVGRITEDIKNVGMGIEVPFIPYISWVNQTLTLR